jgi:hypothetical protein
MYGAAISVAVSARRVHENFWSNAMHIRPNQPNPNIQLDALHAAEKAAAKAEAARTRRKLQEFASELDGEAYVVEVEAHEEQPGNPRRQGSPQKKKEAADSLPEDHAVSDWA